MKKLFIAYWVLAICASIFNGYNAAIVEGDYICYGAAMLDMWLVVGAFFICLFKIFQVIKRVNPPTVLNLVYWLASLALFVVCFHALSVTHAIEMSNGHWLVIFDRGNDVLAALILWAVVSGCWIGFNRYTKNK